MSFSTHSSGTQSPYHDRISVKVSGDLSQEVLEVRRPQRPNDSGTFVGSERKNVVIVYEPWSTTNGGIQREISSGILRKVETRQK